MSTDPHGTYIHVGRNGIYYKQKIGATSPIEADKNSARENVPETLSDLAAFLTEERRNAESRNHLITGLILIAVGAALGLEIYAAMILSETGAWTTACASIVFVASFSSLLLRWRYKPSYPLQYDLDEAARHKFQRLSEACWSLSQAAHLSCTFDSTHTWRRASVIKETPQFILSEIEIYALSMGGGKIYFLPDQMLIFSSGKYTSMRYASFVVSYRSVQTVQQNSISGMEVAGYTWLHTRVDGFADLRYKYNPRMPIVVYGQTTLTDSAGGTINVQTSPSAYAQKLSIVFTGQNTPRASSAQNERNQGSSKSQSAGGRAYNQKNTSRAKPESANKSPYDVLGVSRTATREEIVAAYKRLAQQYHPDKVNHLAPEFRELAERRMREINEAYQSLKNTML